MSNRCTWVLKPFSLVFSAGICSRLTVMTPLLGPKTSSAPIGDVPAGDDKAAQVTAFQVFTRPETRDTVLAWREAQASANSEVFTNHETRDTNHGFFQARNTAFSVAPMVLVGTEALQSCFFGLNMLWVDSDDAVAGNENLIHARRERADWRRQSRPSHFLSGIYETRDPSHGVGRARGASRREFRGFYETRNTRHESRLFSDPKHGFSVAPMVLVGTEALQSFFRPETGLD